MDVRDELIHLYTTYNPKRLKDVDALLERFKGREHIILQSLREKYAKGDPRTAAQHARAGTTSANPSLLFTNVSSVIAERSGVRSTTHSTGASQMTSLDHAGSTLPAERPSTHYVPALKPVTPSAQLFSADSVNSGDASLSHSFAPLYSARNAPAGNISATASSLLNDSLVSASTTQPPPLPPRPAYTAAASSLTPIPAANHQASQNVLLRGRHDSIANSPSIATTNMGSVQENSGSSSAARRAEMRELIQQMTALDVGALASRVEALTQRTSSTLRAAAALSEESREPRLQWRERPSLSSSTPTITSAGAMTGVGEGGSLGEVGAVLQHTSVFVTHFANCARRFTALAQEEEHHWATLAVAKLEEAAAPVNTRGATGKESAEDKSRSDSGGVFGNRISGSRNEKNEEETTSLSAQAHCTAAEPRTPSPPRVHPLSPSPKKPNDVAPTAADLRQQRAQPLIAHGDGEHDDPLSPHVSRQLETTQRRGSTSSTTCVRHVRRSSRSRTPNNANNDEGNRSRGASGAAAHSHSPLSTEDAGSPPACRTTTVSPLTSPDTDRGDDNFGALRSRGGGSRTASARSTPRRRARKSGGLSHSPPSPPEPTPLASRLRHDAPRDPARRSTSTGNTRGRNKTNSSPIASGSGSDSNRDGSAGDFSEARNGGADDSTLTPPPPPPLQPPPPSSRSLSDQLAPAPATQHHHSAKAKRVFHWSPSPGQANRYSPLCSTLASGDCLVLQPGVYYENFHFANCGRVELTSAFPGAAVVLRPSSDLDPIIAVSGSNTHVTLTGVVLVQGEMTRSAADSPVSPGGSARSAQGGSRVWSEGDHHLDNTQGSDGEDSAPLMKKEKRRRLTAGQSRLGLPTVPLLSVRDGAAVTATACHFYGGSGGGVVAGGLQTRVRLDLCLISLCDFAAVYLHGGASADITQSKLKKSEVGLRVLQGDFFISETTFEDNTSDGLVIYEASMGVLERSNVFNNGGNGVFLSSGTELRVTASTIELNALYGVQRTRGSTLHVKSSFVRDNGLLPINEELE